MVCSVMISFWTVNFDEDDKKNRYYEAFTHLTRIKDSL